MNSGDTLVPSLVTDAARDAGLGEPVAVHGQSPARRRRFWMITSAGLAVAVVFLALGAAAVGAGGGSEVALLSLLPFGLGLAVVLMFVLALRKMLRSHQFSQRAYRYQAGFVLRRGERCDAYAWDTITRCRRVIFYRKEIETGRAYSWSAADGERVELSRFLEDYVGLGETILAQTAARLSPQFLAEVEDGRTVDFGSVRIDRLAFRVGKDRFAWPDVDGSELKGEQTLLFRLRGKRLARVIDLRHVNDPGAFLTVWSRLTV